MVIFDLVHIVQPYYRAGLFEVATRLARLLFFCYISLCPPLRSFLLVFLHVLSLMLCVFPSLFSFFISVCSLVSHNPLLTAVTLKFSSSPLNPGDNCCAAALMQHITAALMLNTYSFHFPHLEFRKLLFLKPIRSNFLFKGTVPTKSKRHLNS